MRKEIKRWKLLIIGFSLMLTGVAILVSVNYFCKVTPRNDYIFQIQMADHST